MRWTLGAALFAAVGCYDPQVPLGIPCSDTGECPRGQECDTISNTCGEPAELRTWRDDSAADFSQTGAVLIDSAVEKAGFVGPVPYATGRAKVSGVVGNKIGADAAAATWANVDVARAGTSFATALALNYDILVPRGVGLTQADDVTVLVECEIQLDAAGAWRFELDANDNGFLELAPPGGDFTRVVNSANAATSATYNVATPGWYRLRAAFADAAMFMDFHVRMDSPAIQGGFREIAPDQMRVRVDGIDGAIFDGFDDTYLLRYFGSTLLATPIQLTLPDDPYAINIGILSLSMRAVGQFLIDKEGDYSFTVSSHHGHRVWIDGQQVANAFGGTDATTNVAPIHLDAGWHYLVFDAMKANSSALLTASIVVASGPDLVGQSFPVDHLRPVPSNAFRWAADSDAASTTITDGGSIMRPLTLLLPNGAMAKSIDADFEFNHTAQAQVGITLDPPAGSNITLVATGALAGSGQHVEHVTVPAADAGASWNLIASDSTVDAITGTLDLFSVTMLYDGGLKPFPTTYRYESAPKDLGNVVALGPLSWQTRQGSAAKVQFRMCADASCAGEAWTDVPQSGAVPSVALKPYAQYAVEFTGDGVIPTALDWIELQYSSRPPI
ncbi:MAG TPA: PA14 domain-containing protein [Kofleriaceae bacterium]|nr:PA14 domain-containing protein [Kofleriaceae bacterium]